MRTCRAIPRAGPATLLLIAAIGACASAPPPAPAPATPPPPVIEPYPRAEVWTRAEEATITTDSGSRTAVEHLFQRLEVVGRDTIGLRVLCSTCPTPAEGYIDEAAVIHTALPPEVAAWGTLPEFALSVRDAALARDLEALEPVMARDFFFSFVGSQTPAAAIAVWKSEDFVSIDAIPALLDQGVRTSGNRIWSAPPAFLEDLEYRGLRLGFRQRADGRWEWIYLIRGVAG